MKKLLKYQLMNYRGGEVKVLLGILPLATLLGWLSHHLFDVSAGTILQLGSFFFFWFVLGSTAMYFRQYLSPSIMFVSVPLMIPLPHLWSILAGLLASLPAWAAYAACYLTLTIAFRHQPGLQFFDGWQWLMLTGLYILAQSIFACQLAAGGALKDRLVLPKKLRFLRKLAWWGTNDLSIFHSVFWAMIVIAPLHSMVFNEYIVFPRSLLALVVYASSGVLLYTASYLLEKYSNF